MKTRSMLIVGGVVVVAFCVGIAWNAVRQTRIADSERALLAEQRRQLEDKLRSAEDRQTRAEKSRADLQTRRSALAIEKRTPSKSTSPSPPNIQQILRDNPTLQNLQFAARRAQLSITYGPLYRSLHLSPTQIEKFEQNLLHREEQQSDIFAAAQAQGISNRDSASRQLIQHAETEYQSAQRELLGEAGARELRDYDRFSTIREITSGLAGAAAMAGTPLDAAQAEQLVGTLARSARPFPNTDYPDPNKIDWSRVAEQAKTFLRPDQLTFIETTEPRGPRGSGGRFMPALQAAMAAAAADDAKKNTDPTGTASQ